MRNQYVVQTSRWLTWVWIASAMLSVRAQTELPTQIQWQRVIEGGEVTPTAVVRAVKAANDGYGVLAGNSLIRLSSTGEVVWSKPVPGSYQDSATNRVPIRETVALAPTQDDGFVVLALDVLNRYYVTKVDALGNGVWTKTVDRADAGPGVRITGNALAVAPDSSILVVGSYTDNLSYLTMTKLNPEGYNVGQWRARFAGPAQPATPLIRQILTLSDQGYLLVGSAAGNATADSKGLAMKVDAGYNLVWQNTYPAVNTFVDLIPSRTDDSYTALGLGAGGSGQVITIAPKRAEDGNGRASIPNGSTGVSLAGDESDNLTILDAAGSNNGDFRLTNVTPTSAVQWTKTVGGSGRDVPAALLRTDDGGYLAVGTTTSTDGDVVGKLTPTAATWVVKLGSSSQVTTLRLLTPVYDCDSGYIVFNTTGGDGSSVVYTAPGVRQTQPTDNFGRVEQELRNDPKGITIQATQHGQTISYDFDLGAYCRQNQLTTNPASMTTLQMVAPTYNCETGAITFRTTGGDGSPVEYAATGITGWTTNPNQFVDRETRTAYDAQPLLLMARQRGQTVMYVFNVKAECGRARQGAGERLTTLTVTVLENPARETATVEITGAEQQSLLLTLTDARGRLVEQRTTKRAQAVERQTVDLRQQSAGTFLLHIAATNGQAETVRILKQ